MPNLVTDVGVLRLNAQDRQFDRGTPAARRFHFRYVSMLIVYLYTNKKVIHQQEKQVNESKCF